LRADCSDAFARRAIRLAVPGLDKAPFFEALEHFERAIGQHKTVTCEAGDIANFAVFASLMMNSSTLCENVQSTLFVL